MKGKIVNYKRSASSQETNKIIIKPEGATTKEEAQKLTGKKIVWTTPTGNKINGEVTRPHGRKGTILAKFEKGLPGQAIGTEVEIL